MTTQNTTPTTPTATTTATDFEFFEGTLSVSASRPLITIRRGGVIVITRAVGVMLGDKLSHVQLAYNPKTGAVGLRAAAPDAPGAYQLRPQSKGPGRMIGGKRFFKHHGLDADKAKTYEAKDFGNGIVGFHLELQPETRAELGSRAGRSTGSRQTATRGGHARRRLSLSQSELLASSGSAKLDGTLKTTAGTRVLRTA